jgi:uncharacterized membrane protein
VIDFEGAIGRLLIALTYVAVALLVVGVALLIGHGLSPLSGGPRLDLARLPPDLAAFTPHGFLWLGLLVVIATPITRVVAAAVGYGRTGDRAMVLVAVAILAVIAVSVTSAIVTA